MVIHIYYFYQILSKVFLDVEESFGLTNLENIQQPHLLEAGVVYILLPKDVPITRTTRIQWLLDHINTVITVSSKSSMVCNN